MKYTYLRLLVLGAVIMGSSLVAQAASPTLSVSPTGNGDSVLITVTGDPYGGVVLYYQNGNYNLQSQYIGAVGSSGYFSTTVSAATYGINPGSLVHVIVNNQSSANVAWPYAYNNYNGYGSLSLSQTSVSVGVSQSANITISGGNAPYTMYPSVPNIFQAVIGGNTLQIIGLNNGSGSLNVCSSGGTGSGCAVVSITIGTTNYYGGTLSLSPSSVSLNSGASTTVTINGNGGYYISSNTNSNVATASINGNTINVYGNSYGNNTISVCQSGGQCVSLYVTVGYGGTTTQPALTFSQNNPTLSIGQSMTVTIYGGTANSYYSTYNSNVNGLQATMSGNSLAITGLTNGSFVVVVCSSSTNCGALNVTVGSTYGTNSGWTFCSNEGQFCSFPGTQTIQYGANGVYYYRTFTNSVMCSNTIFGDPIFGVVKRCNFGGIQ